MITRSDREATHLPFYAARIASVPAGSDTLFEDFVDHGFMEGWPVPRGGWRERVEAFGARHGQYG